MGGQTRRAILKTGGAAVVIAGAGAAAWALTRAPDKAREPWSVAGRSFGDWRIDALSYAILAPNPHNMQPWRVRLDEDGAMTLFADLSRMLPETDPPNRQITIGFGAFLELFAQAAANKGIAVSIDPFQEGEPQPTLDGRPIARVTGAQKDGVAKEPLFAEALSRRTNRAPYEARSISAETIDAILAATAQGVIAGAAAEGAIIEELKALARQAWRIEWNLARTRRESIEVTRIGKSEINNAPWGLALSGALIEGAAAAGLMTREKMDVAGETAFEQSLVFYEKAIDAAPAFIWSSTTTNSRADQLAAGAAWVRMQLAATREGLGFHPLSQALQEFPEMAAPYARVHDLLAPEKSATVQMLARIGYAKAPPPSPREPLQSKLIKA